MNYIDAHCHLFDSRLDTTREEILDRARAVGIRAFIQGGVSPADWDRQLASDEEGLHRTFGLHPWFVAHNDQKSCQQALDQLPQYLPKAVALGELGLDYQRRFDPSSHQRQQYFFSAQLQLAKDYRLPVVLHFVQAHTISIAILKEVQHRKGGIVHGFSGSYEIARQYLDLGYHLSIGTGLVQKGYRKLKNAVSRLPLDRLVVESDAPDGSVPGQNRTYNEPIAILAVAQAIAESHQTSQETVLEQSAKRVREIFSLE
jgi:TatD DNase family protein